MVEIPSHRWFLASQFHPELKSRPLDCHPIFKSYVKAAIGYRNEKGDTPKLEGLRVVSGSKAKS
jgi:hypothetical protein